MALNLSCVGEKHGPVEFTYQFKDVILYALSVGATKDELQFIFEGSPDFSVLPTFATIPITPLMFDAIGVLKADLTKLLHGQQEVIIHKKIPTQGTLKTMWWVDAIYDKGKAAVAVLKAQTSDSEGPLFENITTFFIRGSGGFGGERGPKQEVSLPDESKAPLHEVTYETSPEQSYLYRLNGDFNPLHASPEFARLSGFDRPILHGLCTFGFAVRAFINSVLEGNPERIRRIRTRFSGVVYPGDRITTRIWRHNKDNTWLLASYRPDGSRVLEDFIIEVR